jgi:hypothetical protein
VQPNGVEFIPGEIITSESTRSARLKWVIVVDNTLPAGRALNAAACVASVIGAQVRGIHGPDVKDSAGGRHRGLPWIGCSVLGALPEQLAGIRDRVATAEGVLIADMPALAQHTRVYDEYVDRMAATDAEQMTYYAVSVVGPRKTIDKIVGKLGLLP